MSIRDFTKMSRSQQMGAAMAAQAKANGVEDKVKAERAHEKDGKYGGVNAELIALATGDAEKKTSGKEESEELVEIPTTTTRRERKAEEKDMIVANTDGKLSIVEETIKLLDATVPTQSAINKVAKALDDGKSFEFMGIKFNNKDYAKEALPELEHPEFEAIKDRHYLFMRDPEELEIVEIEYLMAVQHRYQQVVRQMR